MANLKDVFDIIHKHKYEVSVTRTKKNNYRLSLPEVISNDGREPEIQVEYEIVKDGVVRKCNGEDQKIKLPRYAAKPFIFADILRISEISSYNPDLVVFYDPVSDYTSVGADSIRSVDIPKGRVQAENEEILLDLYYYAFSTGFPNDAYEAAEAHGVLEGYIGIREVLDNE